MIPEPYIAFRNSLSVAEASIGYDGITLFPIESLSENQVGYSHTLAGESLCLGGAGDWREEWLVIGQSLACGDPIILDTAEEQLPILSALHGEGSWNPTSIAGSLEGFAIAYNLLVALGHGRENPIALSKKPLPAEMRLKALNEIELHNPGVIMYFWALLFPENE